MRICSFLPSATEILYALGLGESVAGVTFECDFPAQAAEKAIIVHTHLPSGLTPAEIDAAVTRQAAHGGSLYYVDQAQIAAIEPQLVITQDLCRVCAIGADDLAGALRQLPSMPRIVSLEPHTLEDVFDNIATVGEATGRQSQAQALLAELRARVARVASSAHPARRPRVLCLEWLEPIFQGGHWVPEMVALAGGEAVLAQAGQRSVRLSWDEVRASDPEVLVVMPCGFHLADAVRQYAETAFPDWWPQLSAVRADRVYAVDGTAYFSRPGPRLVTGVEILHGILNHACKGTGLEQLPADSVACLNLSEHPASLEPGFQAAAAEVQQRR